MQLATQQPTRVGLDGAVHPVSTRSGRDKHLGILTCGASAMHTSAGSSSIAPSRLRRLSAVKRASVVTCRGTRATCRLCASCEQKDRLAGDPTHRVRPLTGFKPVMPADGQTADLSACAEGLMLDWSKTTTVQ